ncbi:MAG: ABC transporter substrate-binding protein [Oscillospiraceae bacterium]|nr:ABC transporter substrate-binding protein [Oscillospiraceae bacterium]
MKKRLLCFLLVSAMLLLSGCGGRTAADPNAGIPESTRGKDVTRAKAADNYFSLNYNEDFSLNPILATNHSNQLLCDLVYENMVELDDNFEVVPNVLDAGLPNDTATYWTFTINPGHVFHDGTPVTGQDIRYSLERAVATQDRYRGRFASYQGSGYDENHFYVTLGIGDTQFAKLLNIPIIKSGTMDDKPPMGSGPYDYGDYGKTLEAYEGYPGYDDLPIKTIHLVSYSTADEILSNFEDGVIDAVTNDPSSYTNIGYSSSNEIRNFNTTNLHYIMFNEEGLIGRYSGFRQAMVYAFDRVNWAENLMHGNATAAAVPMHPACADYPLEYASQLNYNLDTCRIVLENAGIRDYDDDGMLEYMSGTAQDIDVNFIVCSDSSAKTGVARRFAEDMASIGMKVTVRELTWEEYLTALEEGDFDMYYGEVKLRNNFDLTELLDPDSSLNYSRSIDTGYVAMINNYLACSPSQRSAVYQQLCEYINTNGALISIGFEDQQLIVHRGVIRGLNPNLGNPFFDFQNWEIMLE